MGGQSHTANGWTTNGDHDWYECSVSFADEGTHYTIYEPGRVLPVAFSIGDDEAQARLIAAAPELLEALKPFAAVLADVGSDEDDQDLYSAMSRSHRTVPALTIGHLRAAFSAIAKATGESGA